MRARPPCTFLLLIWLTIPTLAVAATGANPRPAPDFSVASRDGKTLSLSGLKGRVVLLDFWASWCDPCKMSFPWLETMRRQHSADSLFVLAVNLDKTRDKAERFLAQHPASFTVAFDPAGKTAEAFRVQAMPSTYLIGPDGSILYSKTGFDPSKTAEIEAAISKACAR